MSAALLLLCDAPVCGELLEELGRGFSRVLLGVPRPAPFLELGAALVVQGGDLTRLIAAVTLAQRDLVVVADARSPVDRDEVRQLRDDDRTCDLLLGRAGLDAFSPGRYSRACRRPLERALRSGRLEPRLALRGLRVKYL